MSIRPYKEEEVTERLRNPETQRNAFAEVVEAYGEKLYWQIRKMVLSHDDAHDILQSMVEPRLFPGRGQGLDMAV